MGLGPPFPIVINQGIAAGSPFTVGDIALITGAAPPTIGNSIMSQQVDGAVTYVAVSQSTIGSGATETFRTAGGIISLGAGSESVILGQGAGASGLGGVAIGFSASTSSGVAIGVSASTSFSAVAIGNGASAGGTSGSNGGIAIGFGATAPNGGGGAGGIAIGTGANAPSRTTIAIGGSASDSTLGNNVLIGASTSSTKQNFVGLGFSVTPGDHKVIVIGASASAQFGGPGAVVIGTSAQSAGFTDTVVLGHGATATAANQCIIGGTADSATGVSVFIVGNGDTNAAPLSVTHRITNASGSNIAGANHIITAGLGTGNAVPGIISLQVGTAIGSGSTLQTASPVLEAGPGQVFIGNSLANLTQNANYVTATPSAVIVGGYRVLATAMTATAVYARINGTLASPSSLALNDRAAQVSFGGWAGTTINQGTSLRGEATENWSATAAGQRLSFTTVPNTTLSGLVRLVIDQDGSVTVGAASGTGTGKLIASQFQLDGGGLIRFNGYSSGGGASTGTLTNAPAAGNPSFWLPINIAGTTRAIPCW